MMKNLLKRPVFFTPLLIGLATVIIMIGVVNTGRLNVRSGPSVGYHIIEQVELGDDLVMIGRNADSSWVEVITPNETVGWVSSRFVNSDNPIRDLPVTFGTTEEYVAVVTTGQLNMRYGPGTNYPIILILSEGESLAMLGRSRDGVWVQIRTYDDIIGWVHTGYIESTVKISSLAVSNPPSYTPSIYNPLTLISIYGVGIANVPELIVYTCDCEGNPFDYVIPSGTRFGLVGRTWDSEWVLIITEDASLGFVPSEAIGMSIPLKDLPVITEDDLYGDQNDIDSFFPDAQG